MDIKAGAPYPGGALSNFPRRRFVLDGIQCESSEGWLQSLKFRDRRYQIEVCRLVGMDAKAVGRQQDWRKTQTLYWLGRPYARESVDYQDLLDRGFEAMAAQCPAFRDALLATGNEPLTHSVGKHDYRESILTEEEFVSRLLTLRERIGNGEF